MHALSLDDFPASNDATVYLAHCAASISSLPITVLPIPAECELARDLYSNPRIFVAHQGRGRRWYQLGAKTRELATAPRMVEIYEGGPSFDHCRWQGDPGRSVLIEFADTDVQTLTHGSLQRLNLRTQHELFDPRVSSLTLELAEQVLNDMPDGRLYTQGLCIALIGVLAANHTVGENMITSEKVCRLGVLQQMRLNELIRSDLAADLSLTQLADEVGLSAHYFARVFKATFGTTPHKFVQRQRLEAAMVALQQQAPRQSIADIALCHGFSSQAHMTDLMRRHFGVTPHVLRQRG